MTQASEPEEVTLYVTNKEWESKLTLDQPHLEHPWQQRLHNPENPHHWAYRSFKAYKSPAPNLACVRVGMITFYTPKEKSAKTATYWVCSRQNHGRTSWWILTPSADEQRARPSPRHKNFWNWTIEDEFYAVPTCQDCLFKPIKTQLECENCKIKGREERKAAEPVIKPTGPPPLQPKPYLNEGEVLVCVANRRWESRVTLEKPTTSKDWDLGFEDGNMHHWAFKAFKAWTTPGPGRIKITIDKVEFYAYDEESSPENRHDGVLYFACQKDRSWWVLCPTTADRENYRKEGTLHTWKPVYQFYAKPDRESEALWNTQEDRKRWLCGDCSHVNPGYRAECEFCYEHKLKESKRGVELRRAEERAKSPVTTDPTTTAPAVSDETKPSYVLRAPQKYQLPFQPGIPSKATVLDLLKSKAK